MRSFSFSALLIVIAGAWVAAAPDQPPTLVEAPGKEVVVRVCGQCHDAAERITKFAKTEAEWADVVTDMQGRGLMADDKDIETVLAYLTRNYGPPQSAGRAGRPDTTRYYAEVRTRIRTKFSGRAGRRPGCWRLT